MSSEGVCLIPALYDAIIPAENMFLNSSAGIKRRSNDSHPCALRRLQIEALETRAMLASIGSGATLALAA